MKFVLWQETETNLFYFRFKLANWPGYGLASQFTYLTELPAGPGALPGPRRQVGGVGGRLRHRLPDSWLRVLGYTIGCPIWFLR